MIKVISFDLDDTLWAVQPVIDEANRRLYAWYQEHAPLFSERFSLADFAQLQEQAHEHYPHHAYSVTRVRQNMIRLGLSQAGYQGEELTRLCDESFEVFLAARNEVSFFDHALTMIAALHPDYQLGALSNGNADIDRVGLDRYFDFAIHADHIGIGKPDKRMFQAMLDLTGTQPEEVLHVGDSLDHDIAGAIDAGIHSLWVNLDHKAANPQMKADIEVSCLSEIPAAVDAYQRQLAQR